MQNAMLDQTRFGWSRFDWENYNLKDKEYGEKLLDVALNESLSALKQLLEEGTGYYHFPNDFNCLITLQESKPATYFFLMSNRQNFYQYESNF